MFRDYDVQIAVSQAPGSNKDLNDALRLVLPVLRYLRDRGTGWKFWLKWGMDMLISAVESYLQHTT